MNYFVLVVNNNKQHMNNQHEMLNPQDETYALALVTPEELAEMNTFCDEQNEAAMLAQEGDAYKIDTYEDKMAFLASIHAEIAPRVAAREALLAF